MKKPVMTLGLLALALSLSACNGAPSGQGGSSGGVATAEQGPAQEQVVIKQSTDKHTWYVKNYVGMNAASVGYTALDGSRRDAYGAGTLKVVFKTSDGAYVDYETDEEGNEPEGLKNYVVVAQDLEPNTELSYTFMLDENGEEYDNLVNVQNYEEIVLAVAPIGSSSPAPELTHIEASPDKYTRYVKDYVGRNLKTCGYLSLAGWYCDAYGQSYIQFSVSADDGSYVDVSDEETLKQYVVTSQSVAPNTPISMMFMTDENGEEYDNLVETRSVESINLTVTKVAE